MAHFADTFALFPEGQRHAMTLIEACGEFGHLSSARIPVVLSQRTLVQAGRACPVAVLHGATYEGSNSATRNLNAWLRAEFFRPLLDGHDPDFIIMCDVALWPEALLSQEHLIYHALSHVEQRTDQYGAPKFGDDGRPMLRMRPHDIERFAGELERYGQVIEGFDAEEGAYTRAREAQRAASVLA